MCHQVIQIFKCGHNSESRVVRCKKPTSECEAVFLREELEKVKALCEVRQSGRNTLICNVLTRVSHVAEQQKGNEMRRLRLPKLLMKDTGLDEFRGCRTEMGENWMTWETGGQIGGFRNDAAVGCFL